MTDAHTKILRDDPLLAVVDWPLMLTATQIVAYSNARGQMTLLDVANTYHQLRTKQQMRAEHDAYFRLARGDWRAP